MAMMCATAAGLKGLSRGGAAAPPIRGRPMAAGRGCVFGWVGSAVQPHVSDGEHEHETYTGCGMVGRWDEPGGATLSAALLAATGVAEPYRSGERVCRASK